MHSTIFAPHITTTRSPGDEPSLRTAEASHAAASSTRGSLGIAHSTSALTRDRDAAAPGARSGIVQRVGYGA
jgi:hypothetical protein